MPQDDVLTDILPAVNYTPPLASRHPVKAALVICAILAILAATGAWCAVCWAIVWATWG